VTTVVVISAKISCIWMDNSNSLERHLLGSHYKNSVNNFPLKAVKGYVQAESVFLLIGSSR